MMRVIFIWIFGLLGSAIIGGIIGSRFDTSYGSDNALWGFIAGLFVFACARLWLVKRERKPTISWEETYANNIYGGMVAHNDMGNITVLSLRIPTALHQAYENKILLQRELICFHAFAAIANQGRLPPVFVAFTDLLASKRGARGLQMNREQFAEHALADVEAMAADPFLWAQRWLAEFRDDPKDNFMVEAFADHCTRLYQAYKHGILNTQPK